ncbi:MAG: hypothetical protein BWZ07_03255 [Alphaproteobacteria bacterium ADurb.BinA280]|nr:MAG: hypothetical protein BWZ07_03255 [Alphaproteobacteria bacterium ADurb.BinA280]
MLVPGESQPDHIIANRLNELRIFAGWVGVIETQVAGAGEIAGNAEIQADALGMAQVQVSIGFGWKARAHLSAMLAAGLVSQHDLADEIGRSRRIGHANGLRQALRKQSGSLTRTFHEVAQNGVINPDNAGVSTGLDSMTRRTRPFLR